METASSITEPIKVLMPKAVKNEDSITIIFMVMGKPQIPFHILLEKCTIKQQLGRVHEKEVNRLIRKGTMNKKIDIEFIYGREKVFIRKSEVTFSFICSDQKRRTYIYECKDENTFKLISFQTEDAVWENLFEQNDTDNDEEPYGTDTANDFETSYIPYESPVLTKYKNALLREMYYLRSEGGRQYKVSNGKRISSANSFYTYVFDMESELYIAADSPITINAGNGNETSGTVLMCEDFIIMVALVGDLGEKVSNAFVCVEPWKLLEALVNRISTINKVQNEISINLLEKGPKLATKQSIQLVPKGQKVAYDRALSDQILMIWGPPGTGKTYTLSRIAETYLTKGKSILIVSHSNVSVDGLMEGLAKRLRENQKNSHFLTDGKALRYGYVRNERLAQDEDATSFNFAAKNLIEDKNKLNELEKRKEQLKKTGEVKTIEFRDIVLDIKRLRTKISERESEYVKKAQLVATTISKVMIDKIFEKRQYDVVMFDEISMAYIPHILGASIHAREHFICVGDFRQLSPIVQSDAKETLQDDIFTYLGIVDRMGNMYMHPWLVMLNKQRRMHPAISKFPNREVYGGLLLDHESVKDDTRRNEIISKKPFSNEPIELIDMFGSYCAADKNSDNSRFNILSAIVSFATAINAEKEDEQIEVGIITPYAAQTRLVRALILDYRKNGETEIRCSTVHQFQGSECDVIIFDAVESYPTTKTGFLMSKNENSAVTRLINVAVTRARNKLVVVANAKFWTNQYEKTQHVFYKLIKHIQLQNKSLTYEQDKLKSYINTLKLGRLLKIYDKFEEATSDFLKDMSNASMNVIISLPSGELDNSQQEIIYKSVIDCVKKGITVLSKCNDYINLPTEWKTFTVGTENATFPIIVIDDKIVWYGIPYANWKFIQDKSTAYRTVVKPIIRIQGEHTVEMIKTLSDLEFKQVGTNRTALVQKSVDKFHISEEDDGKSGAGLGAFIEENYKCPECGSFFKLARGRSGKCYLQCPNKNCKKMDYLTTDTINFYINRKNIKCPVHKAGICGGLGKYGVYVKCDYGHFMKPDEIQ